MDPRLPRPGPVAPSDGAAGAVEILSAICRRFALSRLTPQLSACREALAGGGLLDVAVLGRFKAGKSSFLNCLCGAQILPVGAIPVTSVLTTLRYGENERAVVTFADGREEEVPLRALSSFVAESENPGNRKGVSLVEAESPSLAPFRELRFVDTPGLGSAFRHNTAVTREWLPRAAAALVAVSSDQPVSEQDLELLSELSRYTPRSAVLLTKVDLLPEEELGSVLAHCRRVLDGELGGSLPVFPFSVRRGVERWSRELREGLLGPLIARRESEAGRILAHKVQNLAREAAQYLEVAREAARARRAVREGLAARLARERQEQEFLREQIALVAKQRKEAAGVEIEERFLRHRRSFLACARESLAADMDSWGGSLWTRTRRFETWAEEFFAGELARLSDPERDRFRELLSDTEVRLERMVEGFQGRLAESVRDALGIAFEPPRVRLSVPSPRLPDTRAGRVFDTPVDLLWFLVPMPVFGPLVRRHFLKRVGFEGEKGLFRLCAAWRETVGKAISGMADQAREMVRTEVETLDSLLSRAEGFSPEAVGEALAQARRLAQEPVSEQGVE